VDEGGRTRREGRASFAKRGSDLALSLSPGPALNKLVKMASTSDAPLSRERERERERERAQGLATVLVLQVLMNRSLLGELFRLLLRGTVLFVVS